MSLDKIVANGIGDLVAERDALAARVKELEEAIADADAFLQRELGHSSVTYNTMPLVRLRRLAKGGKS